VHDPGKQVARRHTVAPALVGHDHSRHIPQTFQKSLEEALRGVGIARGVNQDVEEETILIDGAPEIVLHASNADEDFVHVPLVPLAMAVAVAGGWQNSSRISCASAVRSRSALHQRAVALLTGCWTNPGVMVSSHEMLNGDGHFRRTYTRLPAGV
jgi:hypothetical protein